MAVLVRVCVGTSAGVGVDVGAVAVGEGVGAGEVCVGSGVTVGAVSAVDCVQAASAPSRMHRRSKTAIFFSIIPLTLQMFQKQIFLSNYTRFGNFVIDVTIQA